MPAANLAAKGFKLINTNGDYYWVLGGTQCSADKAKEFDYKSFPAKQGDNGTIDNPSGSMFCIWCDYPDAETEDSVISKTAATIAAFGKTLPKVKTQTNIKSSIGSTTLSVNGSTELSISDGSSATWTVSPAGVIELTANTNAANGSVVGSSVIARAIAKGTATVTATTADGKAYTMELTVENPNEKDITVVVGGTKTVTVSGDHEGIYNTENPSVATVATKYTASTEMTVSTVNATEIESGSQYLIALDRGYDNTNSRKILYNEKSGNGLKLSGYDTNQLWTITGTKNSNNSYTANVKGVNGTSITSIGYGTATLGADGSVTLNYNTSGYWEIYSTSNWTTYYLNQYGGQSSSMAAGYSGLPSVDDGSRWRLFKVTPAATEQTTITFTGVSVGDTSVTIGGVKYIIHVTEKAPDNALTGTSINLEYWITNNKVYDGSQTAANQYQTITTSTNGVITDEGVALADLAPNPANSFFDGTVTVYYWQAMRLDAAHKQTAASGVDQTAEGTTLTHIRYHGGAWQYKTADGVWHYFEAGDQLVAYYLQKTEVTKEIDTYVKDWGYGTDSTTPDTSSGNGQAALTIAVVYPDGTVSPTEGEMYSKSTTIFNYWGGRDIGIVAPVNNSNYSISKITVTDGTRKSNTSANVWYSSDTIEWNKTLNAAGKEWYDETEVWNKSSGTTPMVNGKNSNITWSAKNTAKLVLIYLEPIEKETNLNVQYIDLNANNNVFHSYQIVMTYNQGYPEPTFTDKLMLNNTVIGDKGPWNGSKAGDENYLSDDAYVLNAAGTEQKFKKDITTIPGINGIYASGLYQYARADISKDGKTLRLYYDLNQAAGKTFVVDFGLPVQIPFSDFRITNPSGIKVSFDEKDPKVTKRQGNYGNGEIDMVNRIVTYTLTKTLDAKVAVPIYVTDAQGKKLVQNVYIIPASNVYYEDSLAAFTDGTGAAKDAKWSIVDKDGNETTEGTAPTQALEQLGSSGVYGYDKAYKDSSMLSMGTAHKVTVTANMANTDAWKAQSGSAWPTAQFTFKGTGFDIISLTDNTSGAIVVDVYNGNSTDDQNLKDSYLVNNYYGYKQDENGNWVVAAEKDKNALYQIPVMKVTGLDYGEYTAVIRVFYNSFFDKNYSEENNNNQYSFWLDAVRIYDPMGEYAGYTADNEGYPQYIKLRDELAKTAETNKGVVFIDGAANASIADYANFGPNNEVYLANGQAISFKVPENDKIASIQIGAKAPKGTANLNVNEKEIVSGGLSTATEMYYDITTQVTGGSSQVTITNTTGNILSLTNLKITFNDKNHKEVTLEEMTAKEQANAVAMVQALFTAPVATFSPETFQADWGRAVRAGKRATLTVKTSADVESITVDGQSITSYTTRTQRTGWGWWSPKVTYHVFTYTTTAPAQTTDYAVCAVNAEGTASEAVTATLTVKPTTWWNWWF